MNIRGRAYFDNGKRQLEKIVREGGVRLVYYPTSSQSDEPIEIRIGRRVDGQVQLNVWKSGADGQTTMISELIIDQPDLRKALR